MVLDSGARRKFDSGAVRDICEGKGRCDLLPLEVVSAYMGKTNRRVNSAVFGKFNEFVTIGDENILYDVIQFVELDFGGFINMLLEVAVHFEDGAKKYGEYNWQKGIPVKCYIDSAIRHYLKWCRGDMDERHDRAFVWNVFCCIWTCKHCPELNEYKCNEGRKVTDNAEVL